MREPQGSDAHLSDAQLIEHLDSAGEAAAGHLASCAHCRGRLAGFEQTLAAATTLSGPAWSPLRSEAVRQRTRRAVFRPRPGRARWRRALAAAALAGALGAWALTALPAAPDGGIPQARPDQARPDVGTAMARTLPAGTGAEVATGPTGSVGAETRQGEAGPAYLQPATSTEVATTGSAADTELAEQIDAYLIATASEAELLEALSDFTDDDLYALLQE